MRRVYLFRDFVCPEGHKTHTFVDASAEFVMCDHPGCVYAAIRPQVMDQVFAVHGDEIDYIDHNLGKDPVHVRSKSERRRIMAERGLQEFIRHTPVPGTDKSPHTTDWSKGSMDPQTLANAESLVRRVHGESGPPKMVDEVYEPVANAFTFTATPEMIHELVPAMSPDVRESYEKAIAEAPTSLDLDDLS